VGITATLIPRSNPGRGFRGGMKKKRKKLGRRSISHESQAPKREIWRRSCWLKLKMGFEKKQ